MSGDDDGFRSERDFMDALRVLKARSGLSYRDIAARMARTDPGHAIARSTLASLLAGNVLPRRPGQVAALVEVLAAELDEPGQTARYVDAWSRLIADRGKAASTVAPEQVPPAQPVSAPWAAAARAAAAVRIPPPAAVESTPSPPPENPLSGSQLASLFSFLVLLTVLAYVTWVTLPTGYVSFWLVWLIYVCPLPLAVLITLLAHFGKRRESHLSDVPTEYLRTEYRATAPGRSSHWTPF